jgi:hypothetical protein
MIEMSALISAVLSVCHPQLYYAGLRCMEKLSEDEDFSAILSMWGSVFNGASVISNRETPFHRDGQTLPEWYDILCTLGGDSGTVLEFRDLGIRLWYHAGTIVAPCGNLIYHGVSSAEEEQVCVAFWMRSRI